MATEAAVPVYPADLRIEYPERADRLTTFFRFILIIPIAIVLSLVSGGYMSGGILFLPVLIILLFRKKYPRWWFDWNYALTRFTLRVASYALLLRHEYPSVDDEQETVQVDLYYPNAQKELGRGMPLVKWLLAIPHFIVLYFLFIAVFVVSIIAWFAILFVGRYPRGMFDFVVGVLRWGLRVQAYALLLTTDKYPPFSLQD